MNGTDVDRTATEQPRNADSGSHQLHDSKSYQEISQKKKQQKKKIPRPDNSRLCWMRLMGIPLHRHDNGNERGMTKRGVLIATCFLLGLAMFMIVSQVLYDVRTGIYKDAFWPFQLVGLSVADKGFLPDNAIGTLIGLLWESINMLMGFIFIPLFIMPFLELPRRQVWFIGAGILTLQSGCTEIGNFIGGNILWQMVQKGAISQSWPRECLYSIESDNQGFLWRENTLFAISLGWWPYIGTFVFTVAATVSVLFFNAKLKVTIPVKTLSAVSLLALAFFAGGHVNNMVGRVVVACLTIYFAFSFMAGDRIWADYLVDRQVSARWTCVPAFYLTIDVLYVFLFSSAIFTR